ncbi:glucosidase 2 subunit beta isoform X2 [Anthonomus grandis grandis]|uniref:glucosidase 2 subunit beta isoform X2 n=1 Tax=Anthonomus grandis grandis TaxID=2921223 RepID=UPI0021668FF4|nr:glucosidase 2 subunit beta isoform X2 [Anthonomus grandis grandis]
MNLSDFLRFFNLHLLFLILYFIGTGQSKVEVPRPRGVSLSRTGLYDPEKNFTCLDGSKSIPFNQVNDDYCDCQDGSDEPGTSACYGGTFHCPNAEYRPENIPSYRVNDGVCDCCDGTDEYSGVITCVDNCLEVGRAAREEAARIAELYKAGKQLRADLAQEGQKLKNEKQQRLNELKKTKEEADKVKAEREELKKLAEAAESKALEYYNQLEEEQNAKRAELEAAQDKEQAVQFFKRLDTNGDSYLTLEEVLARKCFDKNRDGQVTEDEAKYFLNSEEQLDLEGYLEKAWPQMKPYRVLDSDMDIPPKVENEPTEEAPTEADDLAPLEGEEEEEEEEDEDTDDQEQVQQEEPPKPQVEYDEATKKLIELASQARTAFTESENDVRQINTQITDIERSLTQDFGREEEFASLEGQCFEYEDHEYTYKLCPFDKTLQVPKSGSMEITLGRWSEWDGPEENKYSSMYN